MSLVAALRRARWYMRRARWYMRRARWYVHEIMGDNAYAKYVAHQRVHHPGSPIPTEREFWRAHHDEAERNPKTRCC